MVGTRFQTKTPMTSERAFYLFPLERCSLRIAACIGRRRSVHTSVSAYYWYIYSCSGVIHSHRMFTGSCGEEERYSD